MYYFYRKENIATPSNNQFVFGNEVFNKNYINTSVITNTISSDDTFLPHISP